MTERDAFVRAVCEAPDDDTPRLVFADWLDEHGDPERAEFVRLQCALDASDPFAPGRRALLRREWNLVRRHGDRWVREDGLADGPGHDLWSYPPMTRFRRGFPDRAWFRSPRGFARTAPARFARAPITGVRLWAPYSVPPGRQEWFQNTYFAVYSREVGLPPGAFTAGGPAGTAFPEPDEFRRLVGSPPFVGLRAFAIDTCYSDRRHLEVLAASPAAAGLRELDLSGNICVRGGAWAALAEAPALAGLEALRLDGCHLGEAGLRALATSPHLAGLRRLSLGGVERGAAAGAEGVGLVCGSRTLPHLRELNLSGQAGGAAGLHALAGWSGLARLTRLDVSGFWAEGDAPGDGPPAWAALVGSPHWGELRELTLDGDFPEDLEAVLDGPNLATLRVLTVTGEIGGGDGPAAQDEAAARLAGCPHLADGLELQISSRGLTERGRRVLRDRFGDGLVLFPAEGWHRQPEDWASGRPSRSTFHSEEPHPEHPPGR